MFSGKALRQARKSAKLSLDDVARKVGVKRQAVSSWEQGRTFPHPRNQEKLEQMFGPLSSSERVFARRVGVCGAHGVGKTTLANELAQELRLPLLSEVARRVIPRYVRKCDDLPSHPQALRCQLEILFEQLRAEADLCSFVSDRTVVDVLAYTHYYKLLPGDMLWMLTEVVMAHTRNYDVIVHCPVVAPPRDDGFRLTSVDSQLAIDERIRQLLPLAECEVLCLDKNRETWASQVLTYLKEVKDEGDER